MPSITVAGTLTDPGSTPMDTASIRVTALITISDGAVKGTSVIFPTDANGVYSQTILYGTYKFEYKPTGKDKYVALGTAVIDAGTVNPSTLQGLGIA